jgi:hypothetical protein
MQEEQRRVLGGTFVPVAVGEDTRIGRHVEVASDRRRKPWKYPRSGPGIQRLYVATVESWSELGLCEGHSLCSPLGLPDTHI